ncbi:FAD-dependent oxidoreductase [Streptomyces sp. NPDC060198]|uniref:FAD-dependent oxidoreductase n=1 Tax=Streptomyces sp. NPDC060198 TaxID=3347070 RepID=UPI0036505E16
MTSTYGTESGRGTDGAAGTDTSAPRARSVLISGASIAGPALAYWLHRYGFAVTVVEKADAVRGGGYPIDIRGTALEVVERMGLLPGVRAAHVDSRQVSFLGPDGSVRAAIRPETMTGGVEGRDVEVRRGDLADLLYGLVRDDVEFLFGDSIATLDDRGHGDGRGRRDGDGRGDGDRGDSRDGGVDVVFRSGARRTFDLVVGADGIHSHTRGLVMGPEERFHRSLGQCFAGFTLPNDFGLRHEGVIRNTPGKGAVLYAVEETEDLHGFLVFASDLVESTVPLTAFRDPAAQRELVASVFADEGWEVPRMVTAMRAADDLFFDVAGQIHLPSWSTGRVALVGDAAYAPSFFSGQGSSIALIGAYVLAGELATHPDHTAAFAAYESGLREFVEANQALAHSGLAVLAPRTAEDLAARDKALAEPTLASGEEGRSINSALELRDYAAGAGVLNGAA